MPRSSSRRLLREILLPFVAGMALAYLLDPLASRLERFGLSRLMATLTIMALFIVGATVYFAVCTAHCPRAPYFLEKVPLYLKQLQGLQPIKTGRGSARSSEKVRHAERSIGEVTTLAAGWLRRFFAFGMVRRPSADLGLFARGGDPDRCLLPHL